jgi:hypothetical protein
MQTEQERGELEAKTGAFSELERGHVVRNNQQKNAKCS